MAWKSGIFNSQLGGQRGPDLDFSARDGHGIDFSKALSEKYRGMQEGRDITRAGQESFDDYRQGLVANEQYAMQNQLGSYRPGTPGTPVLGPQQRQNYSPTTDPARGSGVNGGVAPTTQTAQTAEGVASGMYNNPQVSIGTPSQYRQKLGMNGSQMSGNPFEQQTNPFDPQYS